MSEIAIRDRLSKFFIDVPPVVASTRRLLELKLEKLENSGSPVIQGQEVSPNHEIHQDLHLNEVEVVHQSPPRNEVRTLVFFDLETTGIKKTTFRPKITEVSFLAVAVDDFIKFQNKLKYKISTGHANNIEFCRPRVLNKMTLCVNPGSLILPKITDITGLDNYNLEDQEDFRSSTADLFIGFLHRLPSPACLVAHNGNHFDYPLLNAELSSLGTNGLDDVLCVDSLSALRDIFKRKINYTVPSCEEQVAKKPKLENDHQEMQNVKLPLDDAVIPESGAVMVSSVAPDSKLTQSGPPTLLTKFQKMKEKNGNGYEQEDGAQARKRLDFSGFDKQPLSQPKSFSLPLLHEHIFGVKPRVGHGAEEDCLALMRVCASKANDFIQYTKTNCCPLQKLPKMW